MYPKLVSYKCLECDSDTLRKAGDTVSRLGPCPLHLPSFGTKGKGVGRVHVPRSLLATMPRIHF